MYRLKNLDDQKTHPVLAIGIGAFVSAFLLIFRPFGLTLTGWQDPAFWLILGLAPFNAILILAIDQLILWLQKRATYLRGRYTSFFITMAFVIISNVAYQAAFQSNYSASYLAAIAWNVLLIALFPAIFVVLYFWRRNDAEANTPIVFKLTDETQREILSIPADDLLFISSDRNYVLVHTRSASQPHLLRTTLKEVETQLSGTPIIRCHRSHLVNIQQIAHRRRLSRGLELTLRGTRDTVPVSASYVENLEAHLDAI